MAEALLCCLTGPLPISTETQVASQQIEVNFNQQHFKWANWTMNHNIWGRANTGILLLLRFPPAGRGAGHLGVTFYFTPMLFTRACESQPLDIRGTRVKRHYSMWVKVAKLDSIVGKLLSYISLCLGSICKNFSKKTIFDLFFYKYTENMNHVDFIGVLPTHCF